MRKTFRTRTYGQYNVFQFFASSYNSVDMREQLQAKIDEIAENYWIIDVLFFNESKTYVAIKLLVERKTMTNDLTKSNLEEYNEEILRERIKNSRPEFDYGVYGYKVLETAKIIGYMPTSMDEHHISYQAGDVKVTISCLHTFLNDIVVNIKSATLVLSGTLESGAKIARILLLSHETLDIKTAIAILPVTSFITDDGNRIIYINGVPYHEDGTIADDTDEGLRWKAIRSQWLGRIIV